MKRTATLEELSKAGFKSLPLLPDFKIKKEQDMIAIYQQMIDNPQVCELLWYGKSKYVKEWLYDMNFRVGRKE